MALSISLPIPCQIPHETSLPHFQPATLLQKNPINSADYSNAIKRTINVTHYLPNLLASDKALQN